MVGTYVLNLMDKAAISEASVFGILTADVCANLLGGYSTF